MAASGTASASPRLRLAIVTPVYNDWASFWTLVRDLDAQASHWDADVTVIAVNDGSLESSTPPASAPPLASLAGVETIDVACNLGHQRAIAIGLCDVTARKTFDAAVVMDADGEDTPDDVGRLVVAHRADATAVITARRARRSESLGFRAGYQVYKVLFKLLTGKVIDFGNFCLLPRSAIERLAFMPEMWNHLAATIVRSRLRLVRVPVNRGRRYAGRTSMTFVSLIGHGMSAISVFIDVLFVRLLVLSSAVSLAAVTAAGVAAAVRFVTPLAIPGWATTVVGLSGVLLFQSLTLSAVAALMMLANRSTYAFVPATHALQYVRSRGGMAQP
jgi:polyisoprenyl-phosphate glycosyltransferase